MQSYFKPIALLLLFYFPRHIITFGAYQDGAWSNHRTADVEAFINSLISSFHRIPAKSIWSDALSTELRFSCGVSNTQKGNSGLIIMILLQRNMECPVRVIKYKVFVPSSKKLFSDTNREDYLCNDDFFQISTILTALEAYFLFPGEYYQHMIGWRQTKTGIIRSHVGHQYIGNINTQWWNYGGFRKHPLSQIFPPLHNTDKMDTFYP